MGNPLLITRPDHDITTRYLFKWSEKIILEARKKGFVVIDLFRKKANKKRVIGTLLKISPKFVVFNGHGSKDSVGGYDDEAVLTASDYLSIAGKVIYARACQSAKVLGKIAVEKGTLAYLGYEEDFFFFLDETKLSRPLEDKTAALFLEPSNRLPISLLKGHSVREANQHSKDGFRKNIENLLVVGPAAKDYYATRFLYWDMIHQVHLGNEQTIL